MTGKLSWSMNFLVSLSSLVQMLKLLAAQFSCNLSEQYLKRFDIVFAESLLSISFFVKVSVRQIDCDNG